MNLTEMYQAGIITQELYTYIAMRIADHFEKISKDQSIQLIDLIKKLGEANSHISELVYHAHELERKEDRRFLQLKIATAYLKHYPEVEEQVAKYLVESELSFTRQAFFTFAAMILTPTTLKRLMKYLNDELFLKDEKKS